MSRMTADGMVTYVRKGLGGVPTEALSAAEILRLINLTYIEVASSRYMPILESNEAITMAASTSTYEMANSDVLFIWQVVDETNNYTLEEMDRRAYESYTQGDTQSGNPLRWFTAGVGSNNRRNIVLWPEPTATGTLRVYYQRRPAYLVLETSPTSPITYECYDTEILNGAIAKGLELLGRYSESAALRQLTAQFSNAPRTVREHSENAFALGNNVAYDARR